MDFINRLASILLGWPKLTRLVWVLIVCFLVSQSLIAYILGDVALPLLKMQTALNSEAFYKVLFSLRPDQMQALRNHFYLDFIHPFIYGLALFCCLVALVNLGNKNRAWILLLPWIAASCDILENILFIYLMEQTESHFNLTVFFLSMFALLKWLAALYALVICLSASLRLLWFRRSRSQNT